MMYLLKRIGLISYALASIVESIINLILYAFNLDLIFKPVDLALPFYFWYTNKFLKGTYISNLKNKHGQNI